MYSLSQTQKLIDAYLETGGKIVVGNTRKAKNSRTFGAKSALWTRGFKVERLRNSGIARAHRA